MKVGLSTHSLVKVISNGQMNVLDAIGWIAKNGGEHVEIVPSGYTITGNKQLIEDIVNKVKEVGLDISSYTIGANFLQSSQEAYRTEIERLKKEVDIASELGVKLMRHDVAYRPPEEASQEQFEKDLPVLADACREIAEHAAQYGIITSVENHGYHIQHSERVLRLVKLVGMENYRITLDIGNFIAIDEDPLASTKKMMALASLVHVKDFYIRNKNKNPGEGFLTTAGGNFKRGAIVGHGDMDIRGIFKTLKTNGYDGYISIEFAGMEDCLLASKISMDNTRRLWNEM
ncbi:MAG: xylose isomerase domain-containing protein [Candidatus Uhrbacteria bacterium GW2011_GWF2_39_13]|uniref:Xylose isomerase domain-containing protein n=1 Tax=Candidatus Uhrbacteria bacterium GW2011_GWF2_39_13 TaxID=1618995 RepID=A0A0G0MKQ3_9BACT|nr:MAG: xylose isomerase domain-containing protein [Candidatus Uhrbacteria bacterium GW2011_GWF2_39_13]